MARRADRLFRLAQLLQEGRLVTARALAEALEVSPRTVYRDVADLQASGVPIEGAAGVGYVLRPGWRLPPLAFTLDEVEALAAGARLIAAWGGPELKAGAEAAMSRICAALGPEARARVDALAIYAPDLGAPTGPPGCFDLLRQAIRDRRVATLDYVDVAGAATAREVRPLALLYWGRVWSLEAWCELRGDFRNFRLDRMRACRLPGRRFRDEPGRTLDDARAAAPDLDAKIAAAAQHAASIDGVAPASAPGHGPAPQS